MITIGIIPQEEKMFIYDLFVNEKLLTDSDLSVSAYESFQERSPPLSDAKEDIVKYIICGPNDSIKAGRLAEKYGLNVIVLPPEIIRTNGWAIVEGFSSIYCPGI